MGDGSPARPPAGPDAPGLARQSVRPGACWYALVAGLVVASIAIGIWGIAAMVLKVVSGIEEKTRVVMPGKAVIELEAGSYVISHEYKSFVGNRRFQRASDLGNIECRLSSKASGDLIKLEPLKGSFSYKMGQYEGAGLWRFDVAEDGQYVLTAGYLPDESASREFVLSVGPPFPWRQLLWALVTLPVAGTLFLGAIVVFIVVIVRRTVCKSRLAAERQGA